MEATPKKRTHMGRNIASIRNSTGMTQEQLAELLGISQQAVSKIEQSETIDDLNLERIAKALKVTPEYIRDFQDTANYTQINNRGTFGNLLGNNYNTVINSYEKIVEMYEERIKNTVELYERIIKEKDELIHVLKKDEEK